MVVKVYDGDKMIFLGNVEKLIPKVDSLIIDNREYKVTRQSAELYKSTDGSKMAQYYIVYIVTSKPLRLFWRKDMILGLLLGFLIAMILVYWRFS